MLQISELLTLQLALPELAAPLFEAVDSQRDYLLQWLPWVDTTLNVEDTQLFIRESISHIHKEPGSSPLSWREKFWLPQLAWCNSIRIAKNVKLAIG